MRNCRPRTARAEPPTSACAPEVSYVLGYDGFIYAGTQLSSGLTARHSAAILVSADHGAATVGMNDGTSLSAPALFVPPFVARTLAARGVALLSVNVMPSHTAFHVFSALQRSGVLALRREAYSPCDVPMQQLAKGELSLEEAGALFERLIALTCEQLPPVPPLDPSASRLLRMLDEEPGLTVDELARRLGRPHQAVARLFSAAVGMSARDYQGWLKLRRMYQLMFTPRSLTGVAHDAGFSDAPQFTRAYQRWFGKTPSSTRDPAQTKVFIHEHGPWRPQG